MEKKRSNLGSNVKPIRKILVYTTLIACLMPTIDARRGGARGGMRGGGMRGPRRIGRAGPGRNRRGTAWRGARARGRSGSARWRRGRTGRHWRDGRRRHRGWRRRRRGWGWGPYINVGWPWYWWGNGYYNGYYDDYYPETVVYTQETPSQQYLDDQQLTYWLVTNNTDDALILTNAAGETTTLHPGQQTQISHAQGFNLQVASPDGQNQTTITSSDHSITFSISPEGDLVW